MIKPKIFRQPAEWARHDSVWIGFPSHPAEWPDDMAQAQREVAQFANAVHQNGACEKVHLVAADQVNATVANDLVVPGVVVDTLPFGDIWLRDTGPITVSDGNIRRTVNFKFNGWGGKFLMPGDDDIGSLLAAQASLPHIDCDWVFEGGAIDVDGTGLAVTTEQCLLNPNRNAGISREEIEQRLSEDLGLSRILWLGDGLHNDHTDGHVDNLARFVAPNLLAIPQASAADDPNSGIYEDAARRANAFGVDVVRLPSPGRVERGGKAVPASYMNFYIGNAVVVIPLYGQPNDEQAVAAIQALFPARKAIGLRADALLQGGGSFHCISQQVPSL